MPHSDYLFSVSLFGFSREEVAAYIAEMNRSFKESGAIEYSSDVLIGLQLRGAGEATFDPTEAKKKNPRQIEAVILKNRNGRVGEKIEFEYYPMFNYFTEKG